MYTFGFSGRISLHKGIPIQTSIDYMLYRNDPTVNVVSWWHEKYQPGKLSWSVSLEGSYLYQHLKDSDTYSTTELVPGYATALFGKLKYGFFRSQLVVLARNLQFILQNVPSLTPFVAMPTDATIKPEFFVAGMFDYYFEKVHLMPTLTFGVQIPATYKAKGSNVTYVVRDEYTRERLPAGYDSTPIYELRVGMQWDISEFMSALINVQLVHDENLTRLKFTSTGERKEYREFQDPNRLGGYVTVRARF